MIHLPDYKGTKLVAHMEVHHGFVSWATIKPNSREYKRWKASHETEYHGRWQDQQDHDHKKGAK